MSSTPAQPVSDEKLFTQLETWRTRKERAMPGFPWLRSRRPPPMHLGTAQLAVLRGHEYGVHSVGFSPNGKRIVSGSGDGTVRVWDAERFKCLEVIEGRGDVAAIAAGATRLRYRALVRGFESVIEDASDGKVVAWFGAALNKITTHPLGGAWAGAIGKHIYVLKLEGDEE